MVAQLSILLAVFATATAAPFDHETPIQKRAITAASWTNKGCVTDGGSRLLSAKVYWGNANSADYCVNLCASKGYSYAGVESQSFALLWLTLPRRVRVLVWQFARQRTRQGGIHMYNGMPRQFRTEKCGSSYVMNLYQKPASLGTSPNPVSSNAAWSAVVGTLKAASASNADKAVYGHHMVGNTYTYKQADWETDVNMAKAAGLDGFALNMGRDTWQPQSVAYAYAAAQAAGNFKLFFSFDMTSFACGSTADAQTLANLAVKYAKSVAQAKYKGKVLVSTFAGENCNFGQSNTQNGWNYFRSRVKAGGVDIFFMPAHFSATSTFASSNWFDGVFNWNGAWPMDNQNVNLNSDNQYLSALGSKPLMAGVSPNFFTYYGPNSYNKNWIYRSDNWMLATKFEQLISIRNRLDLVQLISWNDFGESHYVGNIAVSQNQPMSEGWTTGMPHTAFISLIKYYATAFKTGVYPATSDHLWLWSRPHPKAANPTKPSNPRPNHWDWTDDRLYVVVTLASPASVTIQSGNNKGTWNLAAGVNKLSIASASGTIQASIVRNSQTVKSYNSNGKFSYTTTPKDYNFNLFVAEA